MVTLSINGTSHTVDVPGDMPLLWVLRDVIGLTGTKFGCGMALCGACTVQLDGRPIRSCVTPVAAAVGKRITTIEGIGATPGGKNVQQAWLDLDVVQCGYCQSGHHGGRRPARQQAAPYGRRHRRSDGREHLSLWYLRAYPRRNQTGGRLIIWLPHCLVGRSSRSAPPLEVACCSASRCPGGRRSAPTGLPPMPSSASIATAV